jgi:uncharacterized membrane protein
VAGCCECGEESSGSYATELVRTYDVTYGPIFERILYSITDDKSEQTISCVFSNAFHTSEEALCVLHAVA